MGQAIVEPAEPIGSARLVVFDLPQPIPITEGELRAVEILLGGSLKELLVATSTRPRKRQSRR
jgi:hypothetical protein